jgi:hypothetical protein
LFQGCTRSSARRSIFLIAGSVSSTNFPMHRNWIVASILYPTMYSHLPWTSLCYCQDMHKNCEWIVGCERGSMCTHALSTGSKRRVRRGHEWELGSARATSVSGAAASTGAECIVLGLLPKMPHCDFEAASGEGGQEADPALQFLFLLFYLTPMSRHGVTVISRARSKTMLKVTGE